MTSREPAPTVDIGTDVESAPVPLVTRRAPPISRAGQIVADRFELGALVGAGATGVVYRARALDGGADVAVKVLNASHAGHPAMEARFRREAIATSRIDHPNVVRGIEVAADEANGSIAFVMELLHGKSLGAILEPGRPLGQERALDLGAQLCAALAAAHEAGVVHRDVKPENVIVEENIGNDGQVDERVCLFDFGIARITGLEAEAPDTERLTREGAIWGTPRYMAPEQARGQAVDARTDIYACGVVLYEMLTGRTPFEASSPFDMLTQHVFLDPEPPSVFNPDLDPRVDDVVLKALQKDKKDRQQDANQLRDELLDVLAGSHRPPRIDANEAWALRQAA